MKTVEVKEFINASLCLDNLYDNYKELCKKNPDKPVSKYSIAVINPVIKECSDILEKNKCKNNHTEIDKDNLPTNQDIMLVLNQLRALMESLRINNIKLINYGNWEWTDEAKTKTVPPTGLK